MTAQLNPRGDVAVLVPAAGAGVRLGPGRPKALRAARRRAAARARRPPARRGARPSRAIVVAAPAAEVDGRRARCSAPVAPVIVVRRRRATGRSRWPPRWPPCPPDLPIVLVHDAARALAPPELVERVAAAVRGGRAAVIPVLPVVDTIKEVGAGRGGASARSTVSALRAVQTPQGFRRDVLAAAHAAAVDPLTDDAGLVEKQGVRGDLRARLRARPEDHPPFDLALAEHLLPRP